MIKFSSLKNDIPLPIRLFLGKALLFFVIWKIFYGISLSYSSFLDDALTTNIGINSAYVLNNFTILSGFVAKEEIFLEVLKGGNVNHLFSAIYHNDAKVLDIAPACNGLELLVLYVGFIICMPSSFWRKVKYIVLGIVVLHVINILRCVGLIYLREYYHAYFNFAHHYLFKIMIYTATFLIWMVYTRKLQFKNESLQIR
jgi:exosortase/archaeosortase family protein